MDTNGSLWVAWSPLDVGIEASVSFGGWLYGNIRAHMWEGQGWQHKYAWLPDNDEKHIAASISATLHIEQGAAFSWWFIDIPPDDINFYVNVSFGQFCTNANCTAYEWGVKGMFSVAGYDVGLYYGFSHGFDFILGNDGHVLIDQYGGGGLAQALEVERTSSDPVIIHPAPPVVNGVAESKFAVSTATENLLVGLSWDTDTPSLTLLDGSGANVTQNANYTVETIPSQNSILMGIRLHDPAPGEWIARVSGLTEDSNFKLVHFVNKGRPGDGVQVGSFLKPAIPNDPANGSYTIQWEVLPGAPISATVSLFYLVSFVSKLEFGFSVLPMMIAGNLPYTAGSYVWDTAGMKTGSYLLYAVVDDGVNELPENQAANPDDYCTSSRSPLPSEHAFDPRRFPGSFSFFTNGSSVRIDDLIAPPVPTGLTLNPVYGGLIARWDPLDTPDLAGYILTYGLQHCMIGNCSWVGTPNQLRVAAGEQPQAWLHGLETPQILYRNAVMIRSLDASGNESADTPLQVANPSSDPADQPPSAPVIQGLGVISNKIGTTYFLTWDPGPGPAPASYQVLYYKLGEDGLKTSLTRSVETTSETTSVSLSRGGHLSLCGVRHQRGGHAQRGLGTAAAGSYRR